MRLDTVELLLVADILIPQRLFCPSTYLDSRMIAYELVLLLLQKLLVGVFDHDTEEGERFFKGCGRILICRTGAQVGERIYVFLRPKAAF
jgi:hypothetical protein